MSLVGAEVISRGLAFILTVWIARVLGVLDFGLYSTAVSFVFLFSVFVEIGLSTYVYRESSRDNTLSTQYIFHALAIQVLLSVIIGVVASVTSILLGYSSEIRTVIHLLWFWLIGISLGRMVRVTFKAHQRMEFDALMNILENGIRFILVLIALRQGFGVVGIAVASIASSFLMLGASMLLAIQRKYLQPFQIQWDTAFMLELLKAAFPFALSMIAAVAMYRLSTVILSVMKGTYEVGIFDASSKITMALFFIPGLICNAFFPKLSQYAAFDNNRYSSTVVLLIKYIYLLMYPTLMIVFIFASQIIGTIYTEEFAPTISVLQILIWVNLFNAGTYIGIYALNAANYEKRVMRTMFLGVAIKGITSVLLIALASYTGAAIGALATEVFVTLFLFLNLYNKRNIEKLPDIVIKMTIVTTVSFGTIIASQIFHTSNTVTLIWFISLFITSVFSTKLLILNDIHKFKQLLFPNGVWSE